MSQATEKPKKTTPAPPEGVETLLSKAQVAAALGVTTRKLDYMVSGQEFPKADLFLGVLPRWRVATFNGWVEAQARRKK